MSWFLKFAGLKAYAAFAGILAVLAALWFAQVAGLKADLSESRAETSQAQKQLSDRVAAEATAVADAVKKARDEEQLKIKDQEVKYALLLETNRITRANLAGAEQRLLKLAKEAESARSQRDGTGTDSAQAAGRIADASPDGLRPEDRILVGELLQIAGDAKQAAEERNWIAARYIEHCERP